MAVTKYLDLEPNVASDEVATAPPMLAESVDKLIVEKGVEVVRGCRAVVLVLKFTRNLGDFDGAEDVCLVK